jgi:SAM-dependent methyltransferase
MIRSPSTLARSLGQNYLTRDETLAAIVQAAEVRPGDAVLEIGPGTGNLTKHLLLAGAHVVAVEKDAALFEALQQEFGGVRATGLSVRFCLSCRRPPRLASVHPPAAASPGARLVCPSAAAGTATRTRDHDLRAPTGARLPVCSHSALLPGLSVCR